MKKNGSWKMPTECVKCHQIYDRISNKETCCNECWEKSHHKKWREESANKMRESRALLRLLLKGNELRITI